MKMSRYELLYLSLVAFFCTLVVVSNIITVKIFQPPVGMALPAGLITYPISFILSDLITEIYGKQKAKYMVYLGFAMSFAAMGLIQFAMWLPAHTPENQEVFLAAFGMNKISVLGSMTAYVCAQIVDINSYCWIRKLTGDKLLWLRNNGSTLLSQFVDSVLVDTIIFYYGFQFEFSAVLDIIATSYLFKAAFTISNTPFFYLAVNAAKKFLNKETLVQQS